MRKVSAVWQYIAIAILCIGFGFLLGVRTTGSTSQDISIKNLKIIAKKNSTIEDAFDLSKEDSQDNSNKKRWFRKDK